MVLLSGLGVRSLLGRFAVDQSIDMSQDCLLPYSTAVAKWHMGINVL
jgi:hypothetical protein